MQFCRSLPTDEDDELREYVLYALEAFILRSPVETKGYLERIMDLAMSWLAYDPNYGGDDDDAEVCSSASNSRRKSF